jgi:hypothetical protein
MAYLFRADDTMAVAGGFGPVKVLPHADIVRIGRYSLAAALPAAPETARVFRVSGAKAPSLAEVNAALGSAPVTGYPDVVAYGGSFALRASGIPGDVQSAGQLALRALAQRGIVDPGSPGTPVVSYYAPPAPNPPFYSVTIPRTLDGLPDYGFWQPGASVQMDTSGTITNLTLMHHPLGGAAAYRLRPAADAWRQISLGHWWAADGLMNNGAVPVSQFSASQVELCYRESEVVDRQPYLVPMWCFADNSTAGVTLRLYFPALQGADLDWTLPTQPGP